MCQARGIPKETEHLGGIQSGWGGQTCKQLNNRISIIIEACVRDLRNTEEELQNSVAEVREKFH